jgi:hypothetical protein
VPEPGLRTSNTHRVPRRRTPGRLAGLLCGIWLAATAAAQQQPVNNGNTNGKMRVREVIVRTQPIFDETTSEENFGARLVNAVHWTTREGVIRRECWIDPGDEIDELTASELERNLRRLGLFAEASVRLVETATPGVVDLEITTRDRLSLSASVGASYVGGTTSMRADLGERNLLGTGNDLSASFARNSDEEFRGAVRYSDLHVFDTWHTADLRLESTEEGEGFGLAVRRPIKHLRDPRGYGIAFGFDDAEVDYYRDGQSVAQVGERHGSLRADISWGSGPRLQRRQRGLRIAFDHRRYDPATGPFAGSIDVPEDTWSLFVGPTAHWAWTDGYREVEGLDTLGYVQDITLGVDLSTSIGARWRQEGEEPGDLQPEWNGGIGWSAEWLSDWFTYLGASGSTRIDGGRAVGWSASAAGRALLRLTDRTALAASLSYDATEELQDLPVELTLGEDNGLRGYPNRVFAGTRRTRMNLELRHDSGLQYASFRPGLLAFFDAGTASFDDDLGPIHSSAGVGLRIGSPQLLGKTVLRLDLAYPFDLVDPEQEQWQVSFAIGQVFTFGGNSSELSTR